MFNYDKNYIYKKATQYGFIRDTLEKVYRLTDILEFINEDDILRDKLALKGGTAINLTMFNLPRLSIDIDLDYTVNNSKEEMLYDRMIISKVISDFMEQNGYKISPKTKTPHSLDSWIYEYINCGGTKDTIKIEVNYSLRAHVLPIKEMKLVTEHFESNFKLSCLDAIEIFGSKINALINRAAVRDLYDIYNMIRYRIFDENEEQLLRKCVVFYAAISAAVINKSFDTKAIDHITPYKIRNDLYPVLAKLEKFNLDIAKDTVRKYISELMVLTDDELEFLNRFEKKEYIPELLFDSKDIIERIKMHPMALWKTR